MSNNPNNTHNDHNPYQSPNANIIKEGLTSNNAVLATRMSRLGAALIDAVIGILASLPFWWATGMIEHLTRGQPIPTSILIGSMVYGIIMLFVIHGYLLNKYGQTVGKYLLGIYIADFGTQHKATLLTIIFKRMLPVSIASAIPIIGSFLVLIDTLMIFRSDHRCLHDFIAHTQVLKVIK